MESGALCLKFPSISDIARDKDIILKEVHLGRGVWAFDLTRNLNDQEVVIFDGSKDELTWNLRSKGLFRTTPTTFF